MLWDLLALTGELGLLMWFTASLFWALAGGALASWLHRPAWLGALLGAVLLVLGPVVALVFEAVDRGRAGTLGGRARRTPASWERRSIRGAVVAVAVLAGAALVAVTGLRDTELGIVGDARVILAIRDVGLTTVTAVTVLVLVVAALVSWFGPRRWVAVAVAWCASWLLLWALGALFVGATLRVLAESTGLADDLGAVVHIGRSWLLLLALAGALLAWSFGVLVAAHRAGPAGTPGAGAGAFRGPAAGLPLPRPAADPFAGPGNPFGGGIPVADPFGRPADPFSGSR
ncbi:hypothetical protein ACI797_27215 [Geodermatophilus sp. SYSU D00691]